MTYVRQSPEAVLSRWAEQEVMRRARHHGWHVLHTADVGQGATMVTGPDGNKVIMPDLQLFDLIKGRKSRLVEVKAHRGAYRYQKLQIDCTGFDWHKWDHYDIIRRGGVPVDVALIHLHWPLRFSPDIAPKLLWQTVDELAERGPMRFQHPRFPTDAAVWDVADFQLLGDLPNPPPHIIEALEGVRANLRIWERPPSLHRPRHRPGQYDLFAWNGGPAA